MDTLGRRRRVLALPMAFVTSLLLLAFLASSAHAGDRVYWANQFSPDRFSFANLDGTPGGSLSTAGASAGEPRGLAMDVAAGRFYWTKRGSGPADGRISFADLDGTGGGGDLNTTGATVNLPNAPAVYPAAGRIYWANEGGNKISYANLDNTGGGDLSTTGATVNIPIGPVVDPGSGRIYWANGGSVNKISYANLNGSGGGNDLNTTGATVANPHGLALDPEEGRIYWANVGAPAISYANLDNSGGGNLNTAGATVNVPVGVAIDPSTRRIYWANQAGNKISFANLDGSGGGDLSTPGATPMGSRSPVLLKAPSGTGAPGITGGSAPGSVLSCSPGSWAPDLLGSWLYRAPRSVAYSWTRDGAAIPGASGNTYTTTAAGSYRCTVSASNPAGSSSQTSVVHAVAPSAGGSPPVNPVPPANPVQPGSPVQPANPVQPLLPPAFGAKTQVTMSVSTRRTRPRGPVKVVVSNGNGFKVSGRLSAQTTEAAAFVVDARARKSVTLKLSKTLRRLLERNGKLSLRLSAKLSDPAGHTRTLRKKVSLRLETA